MEYNAWVNQILKRREERESLLSDSDKIDAQVADVAKEYSPSAKKFSMRGADTKVEAVEKGIPDDHPMKGFTTELQDAYRKALSDPELAGYRPKEILSELAGRFAAPRLEPSMEYKRRADSSLSNLFGLFGEDKSVAFPLSKVHPEIYQQWRSAKQMEEAAAPREGAGYLESIGMAAGLTAGIGGLIGAFGGPAAAASGAVTGGIIGGLAEIPAYPLRQLIRGTEWYKAREASDSTWDKAKLLAADLGVDVVTGAGVYKGIGKAGLGLAKAAERAAGSSASLDRAMADFARVHDAETAVELWRAARQNAKGQQQVADIMESMTSGPKFKQMVYDVTAEYQDRYRQLQELADPYFFKARRAVTEGLPAEPRSYTSVPETEVVGGSARSGGKVLEKRGLVEEVKGPISELDIPGRDPREVIKRLDDESMDAVMKSGEPIGKSVLKAFDEQEALRKARDIEAERSRIAEAYARGREKEANRIEAALAAKSVAVEGKNSKVSQALWKHSGIEQYSGDPLGASKIAKEGKAATERLGLKPGELGPKEAIQAEVDLNKWYDDLDVVMPERNMNPIGTAMKEAPEFIEVAPGVFEKQKVVDIDKTVAVLRKDIDARKAAGLVKGMPISNLKTKVVDKSGVPKPLYHGTPVAYDKIDPGTFDPKGLYGPGYYMTDNPRIAGSEVGGYSQKGIVRESLEDMQRRSDEYKNNIKAFESIIAKEGDIKSATGQKYSDLVRMQKSMLEINEKDISNKIKEAPNVRRVFAEINNPFEVDKVLSKSSVASIVKSFKDVRGYTSDYQAGARIIDGAVRDIGTPVTGKKLYESLSKLYNNKAQINEALQKAGYDGIRHEGGALTGGEPHDVWIAFKPEQVKTGWGSNVKDTILYSALATIATAGLVAADSIFGGKEAEASVGSTVAKAAAKGWKRLYHGTFTDILEFNKTRGTHLGTAEAASNRITQAGEYRPGGTSGARVIPVDVKYNNPLYLRVDYDYKDSKQLLLAVQDSYPKTKLADEARELAWKHRDEAIKYSSYKDSIRKANEEKRFKEVFDLLEKHGYDAVEYKNAVEDPGSISSIIWKENQVKNGLTGKFMSFVGPAAIVGGTIGAVAGAPSTADASVTSTAAAWLMKGAAKAGKSVESIAKGAVDAGLTARPLPTGALEVGEWRPMEQLRLWKKEVYEGMTSTAQAIKQVPTMSKTFLSRLSPRYFDEQAYHELMMPSTQLASASSAIQHNVPEYLQLVKNIMDQHPLANTYKRAIREVNEVMRPFAERYYGDKVAFDVIENDLKEIGKQLKEKAGGKSPAARNAVSALEARRIALEKAKAQLLPSLQAMSAEHAALVEPLARKYATVRVALAAEDTFEFSKYPFLKGMMTRDDAVAAARIKNLMEHFAGRIKGAGEKVIESEPYIHHASHPVSSTVFAQRRLDELGVGGGLTSPLAKFFSRSENSLQLFPEINYIMQRYIPDAEKRIQYATFWQKGKKWGWDSHQWNDFVQSTPVLRDYWSRIRESLQPPPETFWNKLANMYSTLEVVRLIGFAPSVALKHAFKVSGSMAMAGPSATIRNLPKATVLWAKNMVRQNADRAMIKSLGIDIKNPGVLEELAYTYAHNNRMMQNILDYEINTLARGDRGFMSKFNKWTRTLADWGGSLVNAVEQWDRTFNVLIATEMAAKKGLTTEQAIHGILGTTLRNNFLGGPLNPRWLASPVLRSIFIFQGTPFKLWERRFINAYHTGKAIKSAWGESYKGEGIRGVLNEMAGLKRYIQDGERELKQNLIYDAFNSKRDILGGSMPAQLMKEMLLLGTAMTVGGYLSMDFTPQVLHLPFVKTDRQEPGVTTNPFINAFFKTAAQRREAVKYDEEPDFYVSSFARNWLGKSGVIPATFHKMIRISDNDIPDIYKDSPMKYFFAVPAKK